MISAPDATMLDQKLFVSRFDGPFPDLYERWWDGVEWIWVNHGRPEGQQMRTGPGAAMLAEKVFVATTTGELWERHWRPDLGRWAWQDHGRPPGARADSAPGAAMMDAKLFVSGDNAHLFERVWGDGEWTWVDHGTAFHDRSAHVLGAPGSSPALTVAVMGDGFDEGSIGRYRDIVENHVVAAFGLDQLAAHRDRLRVVRIDVVSPVDGVTERRYDEGGTTGRSDDDTLTSEDFRPSRLGLVGTGVWSHCWIETSTWTTARITSIRNRFAPEATNTIVVVNSGTDGGCNRGAVAAFTRGESAQVIAHEMGHNLFGLGDEYHNDDRAFSGTAGQVNLSETADRCTLKWRDLVAASTPLPTDQGALPGGWDDETSVGAFAGGGGSFATGIFHPVVRCRMNQNNPPWCPVCAREIDRIFGAL